MGVAEGFSHMPVLMLDWRAVFGVLFHGLGSLGWAWPCLHLVVECTVR